MAPIKTAICSFGLSGRVFHAPFLHLHAGFELYSVMERSKDLAKATYPTIRTPRSLEELLDDKEVELVIVNTPNYTHYDYAKKALLAGKHVVIEKPFATTVAEAMELASLAAVSGLTLSIFQNRRYDSDYKTVKKILGEGLLGEIVEAEIHYDRYTPALSAKAHKETPALGTGIVYDLGTHIIDQALQLFGMPEAVFADLAITRAGSKVVDYMEILFYYPMASDASGLSSPLRVRLKGGYFLREAVPAYAIHGKLGSFLKKRADPQEEQLVAGALPGTGDWGTEPAEKDDGQKGLLHTEKDGKIIRERLPSLQGNYLEYYDGIHGAIRNGQPLPVTPGHGIMTMRIIEAAYESHKNKTVIPLSP